MHHSATENFQPVVALAETDFAFVALALDVDFQRWLGEREERRPKPRLYVVDLEKGLAEFLENPFQVAEMRALVDNQTLNLVEHRCVCLVRIATIRPARTDHANGRPLAEHRTNLHR